MDRLHRAIKDVHRLDDLAARDTWLNRLAPLPKLLAAVVYLAVTLSFGRYQLTGVLGMDFGRYFCWSWRTLPPATPCGRLNPWLCC